MPTVVNDILNIGFNSVVSLAEFQSYIANTRLNINSDFTTALNDQTTQEKAVINATNILQSLKWRGVTLSNIVHVFNQRINVIDNGTKLQFPNITEIVGGGTLLDYGISENFVGASGMVRGLAQGTIFFTILQVLEDGITILTNNQTISAETATGTQSFYVDYFNSTDLTSYKLYNNVINFNANLPRKNIMFKNSLPFNSFLIPSEIKNGCCELAYQMIIQDLQENVKDGNITSLVMDVIEIDFDKRNEKSEYTQDLPKSVLRYIDPFLEEPLNTFSASAIIANNFGWN